MVWCASVFTRKRLNFHNRSRRRHSLKRDFLHEDYRRFIRIYEGETLRRYCHFDVLFRIVTIRWCGVLLSPEFPVQNGIYLTQKDLSNERY